MAKINLGSVVGPQGPQGPPGADGAGGAQGIPGPNEISQETSVVGITSGHFFYNDNGKVKGKSITSNDIVDGAKKQSEINNEVSYAIAQKQDKLFQIVETIITSGFAAGWVGYIRYGKSQEGIATINVYLSKSPNIVTTPALYTLPVGFRPKATCQVFVNSLDGSGLGINGSIGNLFVRTSGVIGFELATNTPVVGASKFQGSLNFIVGG